jgi:hypothetical protein
MAVDGSATTIRNVTCVIARGYTPRVGVVWPTRARSYRVLHGAIDVSGLAGARRHGICELELAFQLNSPSS